MKHVDLETVKQINERKELVDRLDSLKETIINSYDSNESDFEECSKFINDCFFKFMNVK